MKHVFKTPVKFEGEEVKEVDLDLDGLSGKDVSAAKREWMRLGNFNAMPAADMDFCVILAAKASKKPFEFFDALPAKEYCAIAQEVSAFLLT
jgi:hypothetical protein